jgi:hypothetical protein
MTNDTPRVYGVSYGDGNNGVSQLFPDFYVRTDDPYALAFGAMVDQFQPDYMTRYAKRIEVDGEADYTVRATIYDPIGSPNWCEHNGAWRICEVFPVDESDMRDRPTYESTADALTPHAMRRIARWFKA